MTATGCTGRSRAVERAELMSTLPLGANCPLQKLVGRQAAVGEIARAAVGLASGSCRCVAAAGFLDGNFLVTHLAHRSAVRDLPRGYDRDRRREHRDEERQKRVQRVCSATTVSLLRGCSTPRAATGTGGTRNCERQLDRHVRNTCTPPVKYGGTDTPTFPIMAGRRRVRISFLLSPGWPAQCWRRK